MAGISSLGSDSESGRTTTHRDCELRVVWSKQGESSGAGCMSWTRAKLGLLGWNRPHQPRWVVEGSVPSRHCGVEDSWDAIISGAPATRQGLRTKNLSCPLQGPGDLLRIYAWRIHGRSNWQK